MLRINLLGEFSARYGETLLTELKSPRLQALLAYLLLQRSTLHSRQQLAFLLWPDSSQAQARTNLRNLLPLLRRALPDAQHYRWEEGPLLGWRTDSPFTLVVADFERAAAQAELAERAADERLLLTSAQ